MIGIDYASVDQNSPPDWKAAKVAGVGFVFVRGAYATWRDPVMRRDLDGIRKAGLVFGAYLFAVPDNNPASALDQAEAFKNACGPELRQGDMPPVIDVEFPHGVAATGLTRPQILGWLNLLCDKVYRYFDCLPMLYTSQRVWDGDGHDADSLGAVTATQFTHHPLWLARYRLKERSDALLDPAGTLNPPVPHAWGEGNWWIHQYQGDALHVPGFNSTVDLNRFNVMKLGESGPRVLWVQRALRMQDGKPGVFGLTMLSAVKAYQAKHGLVADGIIGPRTFAYLAWD